MSDSLLRRTLAGSAFVLLAIGLAYHGGIAFLFFALVVAVGGSLEFYRLASHWGARPLAKVGTALGGAVVVGAYLGGAGWAAGAAVAACGLCVALPAAVWRPGGGARGAVTVAGIAYVAFLASFMVLLREGPARAGLDSAVGFSAVTGAFAATWCCDTSAYLVGRRFGRHKLLPSVSPKKTWEGSAAGLAGGALGLLLAKTVLGWPMDAATAVAVGASLAVAAQAGDLLESRLKRKAGVKDASALIPGHGGILDRFDGFLIAAPAFYAYLTATGYAALA